MPAILYGAWAIGIIANLGTVFTTIFREWKRSSTAASQNNLQNVDNTEGLWLRCTTIMGSTQCDRYDTSLLALPRKCYICMRTN